jgi:hypothetical protein
MKKYTLNTEKFKTYTPESCYYAGLIAADGWIVKNRGLFGIQLIEKDSYIIENLKKFLESSHPIIRKKYQKGKNFGKELRINSVSLVKDLENNFNIVARKSKILKFPTKIPKNLIDYFIIGYIDGDGHIGNHQFLSNVNKQNYLQISIAGTKEFLSVIKERFEEILNRKLPNILLHNGTYYFTISHFRARTIFKHYYLIDIQKMNRKWSEDFYDICKNFTRNKRPNINFGNPVIQMDLEGNEIKEYRSASKAAKTLGLKYKDGILLCCKNKLKTSMGFKWKYKTKNND